jgi:APA family basic amino acid/polyamine antiporter
MGVISLAAIVNLQVMAASRIAFAMARDEILPRALAVVAKGGSPRRSLVFICAGSLIFAAIGHYEEIVRIYAPWSIGAILMVCLSAIRLRFTEPDLHRPWKMPFFPWTGILAALIQFSLIAVMVVDYPLGGLISALVVVLPLPFYVWRRRRQGAPIL